MGDTYIGECRICHLETDLINGICGECILKRGEAKMEETRIIKRVGNYSMGQVSPEDCVRCKKASMATIIIDGLCLNCYREKILEGKIVKDFVGLCIPSISPEVMDKLESVLEQLIQNRHLPITINQLFTPTQPSEE